MNSKQRTLAVIKGDPVDRIPVFPLLMSFAQQCLGVTYREFATDGRIMADAQLNIREKFPLDVITACSDAFRITADLGAEMVYPDEQPPYAANPLFSTEEDFNKLIRPDVLKPGSRMADRTLGTQGMVNGAGDECLVLGWVDMPFAEACSVCGVSGFMMMMLTEPLLAHRILDFLTDIVIDFSLAQLNTGAPMIGAGDAAASMISPPQYREFALPYEQRVIDAIHKANGLVKLHICGNTTSLLNDMIQSGADLFNVDHLVDFQTACDVYGKNDLCFKGNLDPVADLLQSIPEDCEKQCFDRMKAVNGLKFMLSPGCEVPVGTSDEVFNTFCLAPQKIQY